MSLGDQPISVLSFVIAFKEKQKEPEKVSLLSGKLFFIYFENYHVKWQNLPKFRTRHRPVN